MFRCLYNCVPTYKNFTYPFFTADSWKLAKFKFLTSKASISHETSRQRLDQRFRNTGQEFAPNKFQIIVPHAPVYQFKFGNRTRDTIFDAPESKNRWKVTRSRELMGQQKAQMDRLNFCNSTEIKMQKFVWRSKHKNSFVDRLSTGSFTSVFQNGRFTCNDRMLKSSRVISAFLLWRQKGNRCGFFFASINKGINRPIWGAE